ncbi:MAG: hypothetical protein M3019_02810 [Candidatus Dormibacteraeota bacterium]|nr:hypothetical protein [Candidatus Dormibacteraeota bacterium]
MPSRGLRGLWLRSVAAIAACLLALSSTGALVTAAVIGPASGPTVVLADHGNGDGQSTNSDSSTSGDNSNGDGNGKSDGKGHGQPDAAAALDRLKAEPDKAKAKPATAVAPKPATHRSVTKPATHSAVSAAAPAATTRVVVDTSDPAPFSAQPVSAAEARVLPVEALGPLSGISFGSGLFIWPLLLAVDVFALAVIARMALRRRLVSPED